MPPGAAVLRSLAASASSLSVSWSVGSDGGAPLRGFTLTWRADAGEWREAALQRHLQQHTLRNLTCGTEYHLYIVAHNGIGEEGDLTESRYSN